MGFFGSIISATVKTALTPLAVAKDAVNVVTGNDVTATGDLIDSVVDDLENSIDGI